MIDEQLEKALRKGFMKNGVQAEAQAAILSEVHSMLIGAHLLDNVRVGHAEVCGIDADGELEFKLTKAGMAHVERDLMPRLSPEERTRFENAAKKAADERGATDPTGAAHD